MVRKLVRCPVCHRQFDATRLAVGSRFRCRCGAAIAVPEIASRDAAVVRCASCGAAREEGALSCGYCGSDFTLHEQDLETTCPSCFARISNAARFCHHCGTSIAPEELAADPTDRLCPACGDGRTMHSRALNDEGLTALECPVCAGLWLGEEVFRTVGERARKLAPAVADAKTLKKEEASRPRVPNRSGPFYRPCPACRTAMTRVNFERISGILLDRCPAARVEVVHCGVDIERYAWRGLGERAPDRVVCVASLFEKKGHEFVEADLLLIANGTRKMVPV